MSAVLVLQPGNVRITLSPQVAGCVVRDWLRGEDATFGLTLEQLETLAETIRPGWKQRPCPDCGGPAHGGDEVDR